MTYAHAWGWHEVSVESFEEYLKVCPDYTRDAWSGGAEYKFRHNGEMFAEVAVRMGKERVFVRPDLLEAV